jgi:hypothetical protein
MIPSRQLLRGNDNGHAAVPDVLIGGELVLGRRVFTAGVFHRHLEFMATLGLEYLHLPESRLFSRLVLINLIQTGKPSCLMKKYYMHDGHVQQGPFDLPELASRLLTPQTHIWFEGLSNWTPAGQIEELKPIFAVTPPPFQAQAPTAVPPPLPEFTEVPEEIIQKKPRKKRMLMAAGLLAALLGGWLVYGYTSQAQALENIREEQEEVDFAVHQIEQEKLAKENERKRINEEITRKNRNYRNNWRDYIEVDKDHNKPGLFGGISGLELTVTNSTEYLLDEVTVTVSYIKENGGVWKTIEVPVYNIPAKGEKSYSVPDVGRGVAVETGISGILSKKMHFCYTPGNWASNMDDPYFCK